MATAYIYYDNRKKHLSNFSIKIAISHQTKTRYIGTGYSVEEEHWDFTKLKIKRTYSNSVKANTGIMTRLAIVSECLENLMPHWKLLNVDQLKLAAQKELDEILSEKSLKKDFSMKVQETLDSKIGGSDFFTFAQKYANRFYELKRSGSGESIENMIVDLKKFLEGQKYLRFHEIDVDFLEKYESWYCSGYTKKGEKKSLNGFGFYARDIRRVFNAAIKDVNLPDVTSAMYPFGSSRSALASSKRTFTIKKKRTKHRNVSEDEIKKFFEADLSSADPRLMKHYDYFCFYFDNWGMNFADIAHLRVYQVKNGILKYSRKKTNWSNNAKEFDVKLTKRSLDIFNKYAIGKKPNELVFPIIDKIIHLLEDDKKETKIENAMLFEKKYDHIRSNHNRRLKTISKMADIKENITTYVARHSFFTIALHNGVSKSEIGMMAGHRSYETTETYTEDLDTETLASKANVVHEAVHGKEHRVIKGFGQSFLTLKASGEKISVLKYLTTLYESIPELNYSVCIVRFFEETDCNDAKVVHDYVTQFLSSLGTNEQISA